MQLWFEHLIVESALVCKKGVDKILNNLISVSPSVGLLLI